MISICRMPGGPGPAATTVTAIGLLRTPSLVAVTVAVPGAPPVTTPFDATAAIVGSLLAHSTARRTMPPRASLATARSANDRLTAMLTRRGDTSSEAALESTTGAGSLTVTIAAPVLPPAAVAVTEAAPTFRPVTMPFGVTLATDESLEAQATGRGRARPDEEHAALRQHLQRRHPRRRRLRHRRSVRDGRELPRLADARQLGELKTDGIVVSERRPADGSDHVLHGGPAFRRLLGDHAKDG